MVPVRFGWVLEGRLGGMAFPTPAHLRYLARRQRVGLVVTLTPEPLPTSCRPIDTFGVRPLQFLHLPIADYESPTEEQIVAFMKEARATIKSGYGVVAHCHKGYGRTGTILACYLVGEEGLQPQQAIDLVREKRPGSIARTQEQVVHIYHKYWLPQHGGGHGERGQAIR